MKRAGILGTEIDLIGLDAAVDLALEAMNGRNGRYVVTPNSEFLLEARTRRELRAAVSRAYLSLPDSIGVFVAARILGIPLVERIPGIDFAERLLEKMGETGKSVFLLGSKQGVAEKAADRLCEEYPGLVIAGTNDGYFTSGEEDMICDRINAASPDLLIVCLGSPRQELWMHKNAGRLNVGLMAGLGGTLDVFAGAVSRAPQKWRRAGLEWLYRLIREPGRILRVIRIPLVILVSLWYRIGGK